MKTKLKLEFLALVAGSALLYSCSEADSTTNSPAAALAHHEFCLTDTLNSMIKVDQARMQKVTNQLQLSGKVTLDDKKVFNIYPLVGGYVQQVKAELGDYVQKGQVLAVIQSGEVAQFEQQLIEAKSKVQLAQKNLDVASDMFKAGLTSQKDYLAAQQEKGNALAELKRIQEVFKIYNVGKGAEYVIKAPAAGFVVEKNINADMQIRSDNSSSVFTISSMNEVWVLANVFESDIAKVKVGYEADVTTLSYPDKVFKGKIDKIFNVLDPETRAMKVRVRLENEDFTLKPEMFANVTINYPEEREMLAVPSKAVIFDQSKNYIMVYRKRCDIDKREVQVYQSNSNTAYITSGLKEGEKVISQYPLLVYNATQSN